MSITNIEQSTINYMKWYACNYLHANPNTFNNVGIYPYDIQNLTIIPKLNNFVVSPSQKATAIQIMENNTDVEKRLFVKFSEKKQEDITTHTKEGFKIYEGIKSNFSFHIHVNFMIAGGFEQSLEIPFNLEGACYSTKTTTTTSSKLWEMKHLIIIPPHSKIVSNLMIMGADIQIPMELSANIKGTYVHNDKVNYFSTLSFQQHDGSKAQALFGASNLSQEEWPNKPISFRSPGLYSSLNLKGDAVTTMELCLYTMVRFELIPLDGYIGERKIWYSDYIILRDGREVRLPNFNSLTGKSSFMDVDVIRGRI
ncbi:ETX/MTX2 family pore-forming toxin [Bacillus cereus]|uniref:ETX/MTX2 family pore-forming toxin n=1 Tax=Bacillus cereus TaxID=1396 RepID=UPI0005CF255B|nr:ETX/MTX2 family pore-forming toxin [Bacillus cereus]